MPDIEVLCSTCGKSVRVSEFVKLDKMVCPSCKTTTLTRAPDADGKPVLPREVKVHGGLRLKEDHSKLTDEPDPAARPQRETDEPPARVVDVNELAKRKRDERAQKKDPFMAHGLVAWAVFLLLAGVAAYLRYGDGAKLNILRPCLHYAWAVVLVIHIFAIVVAAQDTMVYGVLSAFVPGFSFFFLFFMYESFLARAIAGGLLIAFAQDGGIQIWGVVSVWVDFVSGWIGKGGGDLKALPEF